MTMANPRIYVACLASYNAGELFGEWFELADYNDADELQQAIKAMLVKSPEPMAEEWAIHDYELEGVEIHEYESLGRVMTIAQKLLDSDDSDVVVAAIQAFGKDEWEKAIDEGYRGCFERKGDYAEQLASDIHSDLGPYASYIDWERVERDMELNGDITVVSLSGSRYVFDGHF
jgi:antirestriction protein